MGRRPCSTPRPGEPVTWGRGPASRQRPCWNARSSPVNIVDPDEALFDAEHRVLEIQTKLHRWARDDPHRRFDDLYNLVVDPAFLLVAWCRVRVTRAHARPGRTARPTTSRPYAGSRGFFPNCGTT